MGKYKGWWVIFTDGITLGWDRGPTRRGRKKTAIRKLKRFDKQAGGSRRVRKTKAD